MNAALAGWILPLCAILFSIAVWLQGRKAKHKTEDSAAKRADIEAYDSARVTYENQVNSLRTEVQALRDQLDALSRRLGLLEAEVTAKARLVSVATIYIRQLLNALATNGITGFPPVPADLEGSV